MNEKSSNRNPNIILSFWQGGERYSHNISDKGTTLNLPFDNSALYGDEIWKQLTPDIKLSTINFNDFFENSNAELNFEIGIGNGEFLAECALNNPCENFLGVEVFKKSFSQAKRRIERLSLKNAKIIQFDVDLILRLIPDNSLKALYVNFPDPWHKAKHKKRRLLKTFFINLIVSKLKKGGILHIATDHDDYALEISENIGAVNGISSLFDTIYSRQPENYFPTKYYLKFAKTKGAYIFRYKKD